MKLEARSIRVHASGKPIVNTASLSVSSGELVGLIGPNGAGKSTLLKAMLGLRPKISGDILLDGEDFLAQPAHLRARRLAYLPQDRRVEWRLPAADIVMLGRYPHRARFGAPTPEDRAAVARALDAVDGHAFLDRPINVLSGGERTRILLARALAVEAPILLADEPIAALDPYHQLHVMEVLRARAHAGAAVLAVIHDLALAARFTDRIVLMHEGAIAAEGRPGDVLTAANLARIYRIQPDAALGYARLT
ncbi:MAG: iron(III) dicitrate transport ATP-binding protein FecE [Pseudomonadota bacterium]|jgi:iron complex transport system ATP-binding protein